MKLCLLTLVATYFSLPLVAQDIGGDMFDLAKMKSGIKNHRISSTDPNGKNRDHLEPFKPGEKRTIADI